MVIVLSVNNLVRLVLSVTLNVTAKFSTPKRASVVLSFHTVPTAVNKHLARRDAGYLVLLCAQ